MSDDVSRFSAIHIDIERVQNGYAAHNYTVRKKGVMAPMHVALTEEQMIEIVAKIVADQLQETFAKFGKQISGKNVGRAVARGIGIMTAEDIEHSSSTE